MSRRGIDNPGESRAAGGLYFGVMVTQQPRQTESTRTKTATWRVFAAVPVSDAARALMCDVEEALAPRGWPVKWVRPDLAHLTLKFFGNVAPDRLPELASRMARVAASGQPLEMRTTNIGAFPSERRPRVFWLGLTGDVEPLAALATQVERASGDFGNPDDRPFAPHITFGRLRNGATSPADFASAVATLDLAPIAFQIDQLQLVRSVLGPAGPTYTMIGNWRLGAIPEIDDHG